LKASSLRKNKKRSDSNEPSKLIEIALSISILFDCHVLFEQSDKKLLLKAFAPIAAAKQASYSGLISRSHPSGASMVPIWIPVSVSYSFLVIGPISSMPAGRQISLP
jgi:hypothetical protein